MVLTGQSVRERVQIVLAELRLAREVNPNHETPPLRAPHVECDVCTLQKRLDYLCDQL